MRISIIFIFFLFISTQAMAGGIPVLDTLRELEKLEDAINLAEEAQGLSEDLGSANEVESEIRDLEKSVNSLKGQLKSLNLTQKEINDLGSFTLNQNASALDQIRQTRRYVKKFKRLYGRGKKLVGSSSVAQTRTQMETNRLLRDIIQNDQLEKIRAKKARIGLIKDEIGKVRSEQEFWKSKRKFINEYSRQENKVFKRTYRIVEEEGGSSAIDKAWDMVSVDLIKRIIAKMIFKVDLNSGNSTSTGSE